MEECGVCSDTSKLKCINQSVLIEQDFKYIFSKYYESFNFYFAKPIQHILTNTTVKHVVIFKDYLYYDDFNEYLKRYYKGDEQGPRLNVLTEYYQNNSKTLNKPHLQKISQHQIISKKQHRYLKLFFKKYKDNDKKEIKQFKIQVLPAYVNGTHFMSQDLNISVSIQYFDQKSDFQNYYNNTSSVQQSSHCIYSNFSKSIQQSQIKEPETIKLAQIESSYLNDLIYSEFNDDKQNADISYLKDQTIEKIEKEVLEDQLDPKSFTQIQQKAMQEESLQKIQILFQKQGQLQIQINEIQEKLLQSQQKNSKDIEKTMTVSQQFLQKLKLQVTKNQFKEYINKQYESKGVKKYNIESNSTKRIINNSPGVSKLQNSTLQKLYSEITNQKTYFCYDKIKNLYKNIVNSKNNQSQKKTPKDFIGQRAFSLQYHQSQLYDQTLNLNKFKKPIVKQTNINRLLKKNSIHKSKKPNQIDATKFYHKFKISDNYTTNSNTHTLIQTNRDKINSFFNSDKQQSYGFITVQERNKKNLTKSIKKSQGKLCTKITINNDLSSNLSKFQMKTSERKPYENKLNKEINKLNKQIIKKITNNKKFTWKE